MNDIRFQNGIVPAIVRDARSGAILTLAYMNDESLKRTVETGETWFWSRSRQQLWKKGSTSGNTQRVVDIATDCDRDALVVTVIPNGPACHDGAASCFRNVPEPEGTISSRLQDLERVLQARRTDRPEGSYSASLFDAGIDKILKKVGEEATEVVIAAKGEGKERVVSEVADLVFHLSVLLVESGVSWSDVESELAKRIK